MSHRIAFPVDSERGKAEVAAVNAQNRKVGLLVSVRSAAEAAELAGLDLTVLDIKEPSAGALAAASVDVWQAIVTQNFLSHRPWRLSVALGECDEAIDLASQVPAQMTYAKAGPAGIRDINTLRSRWTTIRERLSQRVELVAVAYADHQAADCPPVEAIFELATQLGFKTWLIDTYTKDGGSSLEYLSTSRLIDIASRARSAGAKWVLAGSIRNEMVSPLAKAGVVPDLFGVRGDICEGSRDATIQRSRVQKWLSLLGHGSQPERV
jgi:(5-formylfuran-3-yl)methyl phosphate synthase